METKPAQKDKEKEDKDYWAKLKEETDRFKREMNVKSKGTFDSYIPATKEGLRTVLEMLQEKIDFLRSQVGKLFDKNNQSIFEKIYEVEVELEDIETKVKENDKMLTELEFEKHKAESERGLLQIEIDSLKKILVDIKDRLKDIEDIVRQHNTEAVTERKEEKSDKRSLLLF